MSITNIIAIVTTEKLDATRAFYVGKLGFQVSFEHDCYLGLRAAGPGAPELGFMRPDTEAPVAFAGAGITLALQVADADREHARLVAAGVAIVQPPQDQPWGARNFVVRDPNGVLLSISHPIPAAVEFQACIK